MTTIWAWWAGIAAASFAGIEFYAVLHHEPTLSQTWWARASVFVGGRPSAWRVLLGIVLVWLIVHLEFGRDLHGLGLAGALAVWGGWALLDAQRRKTS